MRTAENSLEGIRLAAELEADAVEIDVRLTSD
jgi:glycerophosphoryl diester phosphodiesterase